MMRVGEVCDHCGLTADTVCPGWESADNMEAIDPCVGYREGVKFFCCGHGDTGYIGLENGLTIHFRTQGLAIKSGDGQLAADRGPWQVPNEERTFLVLRYRRSEMFGLDPA